MFVASIIQKFNLLITCFFIFPLVGSFLPNRLWGFMDAGSGRSEQLHTAAFLANYSFTERKNFARNALQADGSSATADLRI